MLPEAWVPSGGRAGAELQAGCGQAGLTGAVSVPLDPVTYYTALHIAVLRNQPDMVELLVRHGADINRRDRVGAGSGLLGGSGVGGGTSRLPDPLGPLGSAFLAQIHESSPLDLASEEPERLPCLQRLLDLGADVNAADKHGGCLPRESRVPGEGNQSTPGQRLGVPAGCSLSDDTAQPGLQVHFADLQRLSGSGAAIGPMPALGGLPVGGSRGCV